MYINKKTSKNLLVSKSMQNTYQILMSNEKKIIIK